MVNGSYVLYLTCDCRYCAGLKELATSIGDELKAKPVLGVFEGTSRSAAQDKARAAGWQISRGCKRATAPKHQRQRSASSNG